MTAPTFQRARVLLTGSILASGDRTVAAALRAVGLADEPHFASYHHVLSTASWSSRKAAGILLRLLVSVFAPEGPIILGGDETLERRQGDNIDKKGIYRDSARSSKSCLVKSSGLRWVCLMLLAAVPFARRVWALPFLSALSPSERCDARHERRHKTITDWMRQMLALVRRWLPKRLLVFVADSGYASLGLLSHCQTLDVTAITRLRMDAGLYAPAPPLRPKKGRPRKKGDKLPTLRERLADPRTAWSRLHVDKWYSHGERDIEIATGQAVWYHSGEPVVPLRWVLVRDPGGKFEPQALLSTDPEIEPLQILSWFMRRWQMEVTFQEVRTHLGVETQRQWSDKAIERTTPALLGIFSIIAMAAQNLDDRGRIAIRKAAWYQKERATFSDAIAAVRRNLWSLDAFSMSKKTNDVKVIDTQFNRRAAEQLCYAT